MLILLYTSAGFSLQITDQSWGAWLADRQHVAAVLGESLHLEAGRGSFLVRQSVLAQWGSALAHSCGVSVAKADVEMVEIALMGVWVTADPDECEGILCVSLPLQIEATLLCLWQRSQTSLTGSLLG